MTLLKQDSNACCHCVCVVLPLNTSVPFRIIKSKKNTFSLCLFKGSFIFYPTDSVIERILRDALGNIFLNC